MIATESPLRSLWRRLLGNLRYRLLALVLFPLLLVLPGVLALAYYWSHEVGYRHLLMKANTDLAVAHESFVATREQYLLRLSLASEALQMRLPLPQLTRAPATAALLARLQGDTGFDFVRLLDLQGCDLQQPLNCRYPKSPLLQQARLQGAVSGVEVFSAAELAAIDPLLARRAYLKLVPTPFSQASDKTEEARGMMLHFAYPLRNATGQPVAIVAAGLLMNGNLAFVDRIRDIVYGPGSLPADSQGNVTLFLDDIRITTNVITQIPRERALGTRASEQVRNQVLERGERWLARAFVVDDWYISAYEPVTDVHGQRIGMLYAGFLEAPFLQSFYQWLELLLWLFALGLLLCISIAVLGARAIFKPIEIVADVIEQVRSGRRQRIPLLAADNQVTLLATQFNDMLDQLDAQHDQIQQAAASLELKVAQRTDELQQHIRLLQRSREQLVAQGKLAAIGELTAGIAHEINNPTAVILGYMDLLLEELGDSATPVRREAQMIIDQVYRIRAIITNLLQFSRPETDSDPHQAMDPHGVIRDSRQLVQHALSSRGIKLQLDLRASRWISADPMQFQQVLINLIMNAINAIAPDRSDGRISLHSRDRGADGVLVAVRDNGCGIAADLQTRIFDPFFSRTQGGSGLGLSISYRILQHAGGSICLRSREGRGTTFFISLRAADPQMLAKTLRQTGS
ncbi:hypothetical protein A8C75_10965 [Marinobacterium aestuarii]|uniref:histidine kinase n=1 Tax=Marinobacterium aestuarii TaxID=1821621 RepID=A0A1A9EZM8_9GAMM|nr:HAMP domain-containing sensor histidine kinase [Marinobacterium aestuarii]ANG62953.1 hypothetical protein A8C75_10965 [Marinobacterium aestuarii]